jgi:cell division septal protein FtsQ
MNLLRNKQRISTRKQRRQQHLLDVKVRSRKAAEQRNRKIIQLLCVLLLAASLSFGFYKGVRKALAHFFWENPNYQLRQVEISSDGVLTRQEILDVAQIREGGNIFTVNLSFAREKLAQLPQVERVELQRVLPGKVSVRVLERKPVAWIVEEKDVDPSTTPGAFLVDQNGTAMQLRNLRDDYLRLPVIHGISTAIVAPGQPVDSPQLKAALDLLGLLAKGRSEFEVRTIDLSRPYCMTAMNAKHTAVTFGLANIEHQLERLNRVFKEIAVLNGELQTVNLMVERNLPVTFLPRTEESEAADESLKTPDALHQTASRGAAPKPKKRPPVKKPEPASPEKPVRRAVPVNSSNSQLNG